MRSIAKSVLDDAIVRGELEYIPGSQLRSVLYNPRLILGHRAVTTNAAVEPTRDRLCQEGTGYARVASPASSCLLYCLTSARFTWPAHSLLPGLPGPTRMLESCRLLRTLSLGQPS